MGSKKKLAAKLERAKQPNSRRTLAVIRDIKKINKREKIKGEFATKVSWKTPAGDCCMKMICENPFSHC